MGVGVCVCVCGGGGGGASRLHKAIIDTIGLRIKFSKAMVKERFAF